MNLTIRILLVAQHPYSDVGRLTVEVSKSLTQTHTDTLGMAALDEGSARRRDLYMLILNVHKTSMPPVGFESITQASERPQTYAFFRAATGIGTIRNNCWKLRDIVLTKKTDPRFHKQKWFHLSCWSRPGRKQANVSVRMASISFGVLPRRGGGNLMIARVSMLLKSRSSLTCFWACFFPRLAEDLSAPR